MPFTTNELVSSAYYLSGVVSRDFQTVSGSQLSDGIRLLNAFLAVKTANTKLIPYFQKFNLAAVISQEKYFVPNLVGIETVTFLLGNVRYPVSDSSRRAYFGTARVNGVNSLMFNYRAERTLGGMNIYFYFTPSQAFPCEIWGKAGLSSVTGGEDLELVYDDYYIEYLRHGLAAYIANDYNKPLLPGTKERLDELESILIEISPPDLSVNKYSSLGGQAGLNWGDVNIGHGWRPAY